MVRGAEGRRGAAGGRRGRGRGGRGGEHLGMGQVVDGDGPPIPADAQAWEINPIWYERSQERFTWNGVLRPHLDHAKRISILPNARDRDKNIIGSCVYYSIAIALEAAYRIAGVEVEELAWEELYDMVDEYNPRRTTAALRVLKYRGIHKRVDYKKGNALAAAGGGSGSVKLWDTEKWQPITSLTVPRPEGARPDKTGSGKFVLSVAWSPDGKLLACGSVDGTIAIYDAVRMKFLHHLESHHMPVRSMVFSPVDPHVLFTACDDCHIHIYDAKEKSLIGAMSGHASWVLSIDVSPDGLAVATGSSDRTVRLWDINTRTSVQTMSNHSDQVWAVAFRPPGGAGIRAGRLASASDDKSISLYDYS